MMKQMKLTKDLVGLLGYYEYIANEIECLESVIPGCTCGCGGDAYTGDEYMDELDRLDVRLRGCCNNLLSHGVYADVYDADQPTRLTDNLISYDDLNTLVDELDWAVRAWIASGEDNSHNISSVVKALTDIGVVGVYEYLIEEYSNIDGVDNTELLLYITESVIKGCDHITFDSTYKPTRPPRTCDQCGVVVDDCDDIHNEYGVYRCTTCL